MAASNRWQRGLTLFAIVALLLDAVLLTMAGLLTGRLGLVAGAAAALLIAVGVGVAWRRQRQRLEAIARERAELVSTIRDLGRDLGGRGG